jgi:hypothetical protein
LWLAGWKGEQLYGSAEMEYSGVIYDATPQAPKTRFSEYFSSSTMASLSLGSSRVSFPLKTTVLSSELPGSKGKRWHPSMSVGMPGSIGLEGLIGSSNSLGSTSKSFL